MRRESETGRVSLAAFQSLLWPGKLARHALRVSAPSAIAGCVLGLGIVIGAPIAARVVVYLSRDASGPRITWGDAAGNVLPMLFFGLVLVGVPVGVPLGVILGIADRMGPRYWSPAKRARWRLALLAPLTAAVPSVLLAMAAAVAGACQGGRVIGPAWMGSDAAWWVAVVGLPGLYAGVFALGLVRALRDIRMLTGTESCGKCGYSRRGLAAGVVCPECGG